MINLFEELQPDRAVAAIAATAKLITIFDSFFIGTFLFVFLFIYPGTGR
jgi:hypothetical protein